jgi:hypothetical protein
MNLLLSDMVYFDEAGNTGPNLLDKDQPTYLLLSHNYSKSEVNEILGVLLEVTKAKELHFKKLKRDSRSRQAIISCINHPLVKKDRVFQYVAHKEFMVVIQIVDQLIEHVLHHNGIDIYKGGLNISTANILYLMGNNVWDRQLFTDMCSKFVVWMRTKERHNGIAFYVSAQNLYSSLKHKKDKLLVSFILESLPLVQEIMPAVGKYTLDATLSCFNSHCHHWAGIYKEPFDVVVDNSKQIEYWEDMIKFLTESLPEQEVGFGSRKHKYPLLIKSLKMQPSDSSLQIQLADIFGSALNYCYSQMATGHVDDFAQEIDKSLLLQTSRAVMWPGKEMTPEELNMEDETGINPLDFIAEIAEKQPEAYKKATKR